MTFLKHIVAQNDIGFTGSFREHAGLEHAFESFREALTARGINYEEASDEKNRRCVKMDFVRARFACVSSTA